MNALREQRIIDRIRAYIVQYSKDSDLKDHILSELTELEPSNELKDLKTARQWIETFFAETYYGKKLYTEGQIIHAMEEYSKPESKLQLFTPEAIREEAEKRYPRDEVVPYYSRKSFIEGANFASTPRFKDVEWKGNIAFCGKVEIGSIEYNPDTWIMFDYSGYEYEYQTEEEAKAAVESSWKEFTEKITK